MIPGLMGESEMVVQKEDVVSRLGNFNADVLSTPRLIQLLEAAAIQAIQEFLPSDQLTLGTQVRMRHLAPTPLGMKVRAHALLKKVDEQRLSFAVDAYDEADKVAEGEHERIIVSKEQFLQKVNRKKGKNETPGPKG